MSLINRLLLLILVGLLVYALWPRKPGLTKFNPESAATYQADAWLAVAEGESLRAAKSYFLLFEREFGIPPTAALMAAQNASRSLQIIRKAADEADQEKARPAFQELYAILKRETKGEWDSDLAARRDFAIWVAVASGTDPQTLATSITELWGMLYGPQAGSLTGPATSYAEAMIASSAVRTGITIDHARTKSLLDVAWQGLRAAVPRPES
jgi:hypothetical protein